MCKLDTSSSTAQYCNDEYQSGIPINRKEIRKSLPKDKIVKSTIYNSKTGEIKEFSYYNPLYEHDKPRYTTTVFTSAGQAQRYKGGKSRRGKTSKKHRKVLKKTRKRNHKY